MSKRVNLKQSRRSILVDAIIEFAWDEYEQSSDYIKLAKMSESELYDDLVNIKEYFQNLDDTDDKTVKEIQEILEYLITLY